MLSLAGPTSDAVQATAHVDPVASLVAALAVILVAAWLAGEAATRLGQPPVLGELLAGVVLGNLGLAWLERIEGDVALGMLAGLGVLVLLFEVGLESTVSQMRRVGGSALLVAIVGVIVPFALGWGVSAWLLPGASPYTHAFLGATLCATSVGITARVLKDLGRSKSPEARVILGAAVIDDVLGLVILAVVTGMIAGANSGEPFSLVQVGLVVGKALLFLVGALLLGTWLSPGLFRLASRLRSGGTLLTLGLATCFVLAWLSSALGLAAIVGAFTAGLILEDSHFRRFVERGEKPLGELLRPLSSFLVPIFFVLTGMRTDLRALFDPGTLGLAAALTAAAIAGKQACSLAVLGRAADRLSVGLGMVPRGEVGLIFASIGLTLAIGDTPVIDAAVYSAIVVMVMVTTLITPPALKLSLGRLPGSPGDAPPPPRGSSEHEVL